MEEETDYAAAARTSLESADELDDVQEWRDMIRLAQTEALIAIAESLELLAETKGDAIADSVPRGSDLEEQSP